MGADTRTRESVLEPLVRMLVEMTEEWNRDVAGSIGADTWFVADLGFTSMDLVMVVVEVKARYEAYDMPFEDLFAPGGTYVTDLRVGDLAAFVDARLAAPAPAGGS